MYSNTLACKAALLLTALLLHPVSQAQLYKWVDANGKVHYSDRKEGAGKAQVDAIRHDAAPAPPTGDEPTWQERERQFKLRQAARSRQDVPPQSARPRRLSHSYGTNQIDTDKSKCELARDVISGAMGHVNGAITDANDLQIAKNDIRNFCR